MAGDAAAAARSFDEQLAAAVARAQSAVSAAEAPEKTDEQIVEAIASAEAAAEANGIAPATRRPGRLPERRGISSVYATDDVLRPRRVAGDGSGGIFSYGLLVCDSGWEWSKLIFSFAPFDRKKRGENRRRTFDAPAPFFRTRLRHTAGVF